MLRRGNSLEFRVESLELGRTCESALFVWEVQQPCHPHSFAAVISFLQYRSSHVIPTVSQQPCRPHSFAAAMSSQQRYVRWRGSMAASLFYVGRVALRFTAALMSGRPYRARPRQLCYPCVFAAAMSSPRGQVRWLGIYGCVIYRISFAE